MSRCFPFPPPGYEKKARTDDVDLLAKEKQKEKKHKREKRDKEKKDKERSKDKHKDKKDRKEKHRDKKDKDKNNDENRTSDGIKVEDRSVGQNGAKIGELVQWAEEINSKKVLVELGRRIRDEEGAERNDVLGFSMEKNKAESDDRRHQKHREGSRYVGNESTPVLDQRRQEGMLSSVEKDMAKGVGAKEKNKDKEKDDKKEDKQKDREREKKRKDKEKKKEETVKEKLEEKGAHKPREHNQLRESVKKEGVEVLNHISKPTSIGSKSSSNEDGKQKEHNQLRESVNKEGVEVLNHISKPTSIGSKSSSNKDGKQREHDQLRESVKNESVEVLNHIKRKSIGMKSGSIEDGKKRKEPEMNGFIHESEIWPNKLPRQSSSHLQLENGRKPEPLRMTIPCAPDRPGAPDGKKVNIKREPKINGIIEACTPSFSMKAPASVDACEIGEASTTRPPHPDVKYLGQIYAIPKMEEWCDHDDDQQWLFGSRDNSRRLQKPKVDPEVCETVPQVWAKAIQLQPADICALPYVIPY